ncbi:MAG: hypothetical protein JEZ03_17020 [Bacteroidales bacterium]|nr:hypothetical protein [Bacteroidales bacterium]
MNNKGSIGSIFVYLPLKVVDGNLCGLSMKRNLFFKLIVVLLLHFMVGTQSFAQANVMQDVQTNVFVFASNKDHKMQFSSDVFSRLSTLWKLPVSELNFILNLQTVITDAESGEGAEFYVNFQKPVISNPALHHGFDIREFIAPDRVDFSVYVYLKNGTLISVYEFEAVEVGTGESQNAIVKVKDFESKFLDCKIGNMNFYHSEQGRDVFEKRTNLINRYYTEKVDIQTQLQELQQLQFGEDQDVFRNHKTVLLSSYFVNNGFNTVVRELNLSESEDPLGVLPEFEALKFHTDLAADACRSQQQKYFNKALNYNYSFGNFLKKEIDDLSKKERYNEARDLIHALEYFCVSQQLDYIPTIYFAENLKKVSKGLFDAYVHVAEQALNSGLFEMSKTYIEQAKMEFNKDSLVKSRELQKIEMRLYQYKMDLVHNELENQNHQKALHHLIEADQLYTYYHLDFSRSTMDQLYQQIYSNSVTQSVEDIAQSTLDYEAYPERERDPMCVKYIQQYQNLIKRAEIKVLSSDFLGVQRLLIQADDIRQKVYCDYQNLTDAKELLASVNSAIQYQNLLVEINQLAQRGDFEKLISTYNQAENLYHQAHLRNQGLYLVDLSDYARIRQNQEFYKVLTEYFMNNQEFDHAKKVLFELYLMDAHNPQIVRLQELLGARMAIADQKSNPEANPRSFLNDYTQGHKWFKPFREAYLLIWKTS